jgi:hypothetical protein
MTRLILLGPDQQSSVSFFDPWRVVGPETPRHPMQNNDKHEVITKA